MKLKEKNFRGDIGKEFFTQRMGTSCRDLEEIIERNSLLRGWAQVAEI